MEISSLIIALLRVRQLQLTMTDLDSFRFVTLVVVFQVITLIHESNSANILMTGVQKKSHMFDQLTLAEKLVSRGHQVYYAVASRYL